MRTSSPMSTIGCHSVFKKPSFPGIVGISSNAEEQLVRTWNVRLGNGLYALPLLLKNFLRKKTSDHMFGYIPRSFPLNLALTRGLVRYLIENHCSTLNSK